MTFLSSQDFETTNEDTRVINYLRISITDKCNLACQYCVPKDSLPLLLHEDIARYEEILRITNIAVKLGITKVRITGGEPLIKKGVLNFIKKISKIKGIEDISITTNGVLLKQNIDQLIDSGVNRLNISLDTLKPEKFKSISGRDFFDKVWNGIMAAHEKGITPIKLNTVALRGVNDDEMSEIASLTLKYPFHVRFIEYMPMGNSAVDISQQILTPEIKNRIEKDLGPLQPVDRAKHDGPARRFKALDAIGEIGFISPISSHFCHQCSRMRLTSTGKLRPCLLNNYELDILSSLRNGASDKELTDIIKTAFKTKPAQHRLDKEANVKTQMSTIGG